MTQTERRIFLIQYLLRENHRFYGQKVPSGKAEQETLLRSLMNVRMPLPISDEFLKVQDAYLQERNRERGITEAKDIPTVPSDSRLSIWKGDITTLRCDAIVNACNDKMLGCFAPMHDCIDNFIHTYAGVQLRLEMNRIMEAQGHDEETGQSKITSGYNLPAKYILHTVGPIVDFQVTAEKEAQLASCYRECMRLAQERGTRSVAFCCISTGVFRFPNRRAAEIAVDTVTRFLDEQEVTEKSGIQQVIFNVFKEEDRKIYEELLR